MLQFCNLSVFACCTSYFSTALVLLLCILSFSGKRSFKLLFLSHFMKISDIKCGFVLLVNPSLVQFLHFHSLCICLSVPNTNTNTIVIDQNEELHLRCSFCTHISCINEGRGSNAVETMYLNLLVWRVSPIVCD